MRQLAWIGLVAWGCGGDPTGVLAMVGQAPPPCEGLSVVGGAAYAFPGDTLRLEACGLARGQAFAVYGGRSLGAPAACPAELGGACLALGAPVVRVAVGVATVPVERRELTVPGGPGPLHLQLVRERPSRPPALAPVVSLMVLDRAGDADGDGLSNDEEDARGLDPLDADVDDDGLLDGEEIARGTSPRRSDTDGDLLSDGEEVAFGSDPTLADTDGDGLSDLGERQQGGDPRDPDTDGDGLADGEEALIYRTSPSRADTDLDGLDDGVEVALGTAPRTRDTDRDGVSDGQEVADGTLPLVVDTDADGLTDGAEKQLGTNPLDPNTDGDRLPDAEEVARQTDPLDASDPYDFPIGDTGVDTGERSCPPGQLLSCWGWCVDDARGDLDCERWLDCPRYFGDYGDCDVDPTPPACAPGTIADCWGGCSPTAALADGVCEPEFACPMRGWDEGDCPLPAGAVATGTWVVDSPAAAAALAGVGQLDGLLVIAEGAPDPLMLPGLVAVESLQVVGGPATVSLPDLEVIGDASVIGGPDLASIALPSLHTAVRGLAFDDAPALATLSLPALRRVGDGLRLARLPALTAASFDALESVGQLTVEATAPATLSLPTLARVADHVVFADTGATPFYAPSLGSIGGELRLRTTAGEVDLPALTFITAVSGREAHAPRVLLPALGWVDDIALWEAEVGEVDLSSLQFADALLLRAGELSLGALEEVGTLQVAAVTASDLGALRRAGDVVWRADRFVAPVLVSARTMDVQDGDQPLVLDLSALVEVEEGLSFTILRAPVTVELPALERTATVPLTASRAYLSARTRDGSRHDTTWRPKSLFAAIAGAVVHAPMLVEAASLPLSPEVVAPNVRSAWSVEMGRAQAVTADQLEVAAWVNVGPRTLVAPALQRVDWLSVSLDGAVEAPALTDATSVHAWHNAALTLPALVRLGLGVAAPAFGAEVDGDGLDANWTSGRALELPALREATELQVSERRVVDQPMAERAASYTGAPPSWGVWELPALERLGALSLIHDRRMTAVSMPNLTVLTGKLRVHDAPNVAEVSLPSLVNTAPEGWINLVNLPALTSLELDGLRTVGRLALVNVGMTSLDLPGLALAYDHLTAYENDALTAWRLGGVTSALEVYLTNNAVLADVDLGALQQVDRVTLLRLPALDVCAVVGSLGGAPGQVLTDVSCP